MTASPTDALLDATFTRLRSLTPYVDGRVGVLDPAPSPLDGERLDALLEAVGAARATSDDRVRVMLGLHGSVFYRVMPVLGAYLADGRVPCVDVGCTDVAWAGGDTPGRLTVCGRFVDGAGDGEVHDALVSVAAPVVRAFARRGPLRERVLWLSASDTIAGGLLWLGELLGTAARAAPVATALLGRRGSAFASPRAQVRTYGAEGRTRAVHVRATCCLSWRLDGGTLCSSCPLVDEPDRERLVLAGLGVVGDG